MKRGSATIIRADACDLPLRSNSVDLVVTSPPYFALRSYTDDGNHYAGQIGDEPTPAEYVDALIEATYEMRRVVKPSGHIWVNLGDKYSGAGQQTHGRAASSSSSVHWQRTKQEATGARAKSLIGIPWRYAIRAIDELGLILRAEIIWDKPNPIPESATDRVRRSHETWFHFTLSPRYFSSFDVIRERHATEGRAENAPREERGLPAGVMPHHNGMTNNPLGRMPGSVWRIASEPFDVPAEIGADHFAAFPIEWPRRIIAACAPSAICDACGEGRRPIVRNDVIGERVGGRVERNVSSGNVGRLGYHHAYAITGYACACATTEASTRPGVVLDTFGGTGTTALAAKALGRRGISNDKSADYCRIAAWRVNDPRELARAARAPFTPSPVYGPDQMELFAL